MGPKPFYLGVLGSNFENHCHVWNQHCPICLYAKFHAKLWTFGTKKDLIWVFLDKILKKPIAIFEGSTHEFVKAKEIHATPKKLNLGQNSLLFG